MISKDGRRWFTKEEDQWLIDNYMNYKNWKETTEAFNERFGTNYEYKLKVKSKNGKAVDIRPVANRGERLGLTRKNTNYGFSEEENEFLKKHALNYSSEKLAKLLYSEFGTRHSAGAVRVHVNKKLGIKKGVGFQSEDSLERIGKKPIGTISWNRNDGYFIKLKDSGNHCIDWYPYGRYLLEQETGEKFPKDWQVIYLDGDKRNLDINNLLAISKMDNIYLMNNKGYGKGELTKTWIAYGRLKQAIKSKGE